MPRVDFNELDFENLINQKGYDILWEQQLRCPCVDPITGRVTPDCVNCSARGFYYLPGVQIKGIITHQSKEVNLNDMRGVLEPGEAFLTVTHDNFIGAFDRITNLNSTTIYSETVIYNPNLGNSLRYPPVGNIVSCITQPGQNVPVVQLVQGTNYTVDSQGNLTFITAMQPQQAISIRYFYNPVWIVHADVNFVRDTYVAFQEPVDTFVNMPIRVKMRLEALNSGN